MERYPYQDFDWQYQDPSSYYETLPTAASSQPYAGQIPYPAAQGGVPRYPAQPSVAAAHAPQFQVPGAPASAYPFVPDASQWYPSPPQINEEQSREKIRRTRTACEECRKRKQKCDGHYPCQPCLEQRSECRYRDIQPTKKDSDMDRMIQLAEGNNNRLTSMSNDIESMNTTLRSIERRLERTWQPNPQSSADNGARSQPPAAVYPQDASSSSQYASSSRTSADGRARQSTSSSARPSKRRR